jgi:hypothetical protein
LHQRYIKGYPDGLDQSFPDMPKTHWAFGDNEESTKTHVYKYDDNGLEIMIKYIEEPLW